MISFAFTGSQLGRYQLQEGKGEKDTEIVEHCVKVRCSVPTKEPGDLLQGRKRQKLLWKPIKLDRLIDR